MQTPAHADDLHDARGFIGPDLAILIRGDYVVGDAGADSLDGGTGNDGIDGGAGNDRLIPGALSYDLWGDAGRDTAELPKNARNMTVIDSSGDGTLVELAVKVGKNTVMYTLNYVETLKIGSKTYKTKDL